MLVGLIAQFFRTGSVQERNIRGADHFKQKDRHCSISWQTRIS